MKHPILLIGLFAGLCWAILVAGVAGYMALCEAWETAFRLWRE